MFTCNLPENLDILVTLLVIAREPKLCEWAYVHTCIYVSGNLLLKDQILLSGADIEFSEVGG